MVLLFQVDINNYIGKLLFTILSKIFFRIIKIWTTLFLLLKGTEISTGAAYD